MTINLNACRIASSGNIILPKGRLSYAQFLVEPKKSVNPDTGKERISYNLNVLIPPTVDLSLLKKEMAKVALANLDGDQKRAKNFVEKRFLDPNNLPQGGKPMGEEFEGWTLLRASSSVPPEFAYPNGKKIPTTEISKELYSGRFASASINLYWTNNKTNPGVCLGLQNVQLLDHAENLGVAIPKAEDEFEAVDGIASGSDDTDVDNMFN